MARLERRARRDPDITLLGTILMLLSTLVPPWPRLASSAHAEPKASDLDRNEVEVARFEQIAERHLDSVWRCARDLGVPTRDLEDIAQEVMLVCVRRLGDIDPGRERAFLLATTTRVVANWRRGQRRRPAESLDRVQELGAAELELRVRRGGPAEALEHKRELELVQAALEQMTECQRVAFTLFEIEELTAREIASELGLSEMVVFARVQRARAVFHRFVERARSAGEGPGAT
jgi:RNA polymerase sigma-70 factor (ECF subfamily)